VTDQGQARKVLGFPDGYVAAYMIGFGYPADGRPRPLTTVNRRPFGELVHWEQW